MIGDMNQERLEHAKKVGFEPMDLTKSDKLGELIAEILGEPEVDAAVDAVGFEASGHGPRARLAGHGAERLMAITRAGGHRHSGPVCHRGSGLDG